MTIRLENIRLAAPAIERPLFDGLTLHIEDNSRVGILGTDKVANNTLLRLICGTKLPEDGTVWRDRRVSWPIPLSSFLATGHTIARNARFIARLYGIDDEEFPRRIAAPVELTEFVNTPLGKCPRFAKARLAFALGIGLDFDTYLFDGSVAPVDKPFKQKAGQISAERTAGRGVVVATSVPAEVEQNCESVYVLEQGRATFFADANQGVEHFKQILATEKKRDKAVGVRPEGDEDEEETLGDVDMIGAAIAAEI